MHPGHNEAVLSLAPAPAAERAAVPQDVAIAGVDGCKAGWVVVLAHPLTRDARQHQVMVCAQFAEVLALTPAPTVLAVDMPIGLLDVPQPGGRTCDRLARQVLGRRASSVFTPPARTLLDATSYAQVRDYGLSIQSFHILPKIREVDRLMTPVLQQRLYEAHPELAFARLAGQPMRARKNMVAGREERLQTLERSTIPFLANIRLACALALQHYPRRQLAPDDVLDAFALLHTAWCIVQGQAYCLPSPAPCDARGLRMEICY
ncbi:MAG: DUF429 domain-containing protein [Candidatus Tectimicrobiota bacterium]